MAAHTNKQPLTITSVALIAIVALLPACSTVSVNKQTSAKTITAQRGNIVTGKNLSSDTASALLSAGLNEQACMQQFDLCLTQLTDSILNRTLPLCSSDFCRTSIMQKHVELAESQDCRNALARPPLDPYYANAPFERS